MKRGYKFIILIAIIVIIVLMFGTLFFESPKKADTVLTGNNTTEFYFVKWELKEGSLSSISDSTDKKTSFEDAVLMNQGNLKKVIFNLKWVDDKAIFGVFGLDTLTLTVTTPDGYKYQETMKSAKNTKEGNIILEISVEETPSIEPIKSESLFESQEQLKNKPYYLDKWVDEEFTIDVCVTVGEIFGKIRPRDKGNDFDLEITYEYYYASLVEENIKNTESSDDSSIKTTYIPPASVCPFCDGHVHHELGCPYYYRERREEREQRHHDPFDDPWDPWDDW